MAGQESRAEYVQHTPGPWDISSRSINQYGIRRQFVSTADKPVALVYGTPQEEDDNDANARPIAAAPDLLAALEDVSRAYQQMFDVMPVAWQTYDDTVQAAIAKARGQ